MNNPSVVIIGGGPAGLMAAEAARAAGAQVHLYDHMASVGRKILIAGKGGLNLTHCEAEATFRARYAERAVEISAWLDRFDADSLRAWATGLGVETFVGSSGRVFPSDLKAAPLLRGWLRRLRRQGVQFHVQHRWTGWHDDGALRIEAPTAVLSLRPAAAVLALGGGSWARLGSDGAWLPWLAQQGVDLAPLQAANCGFETRWSEHFRERYAGQPVKPAALASADPQLPGSFDQGEFVISEYGVEGSLIYAHTAAIRQQIAAADVATVHLDLCPSQSLAALTQALSKPRGKRSFSETLRRNIGVSGARAGLLRELAPQASSLDSAALAALLKALPLHLHAARPIDEAISSAGGVVLEALDQNLMLRQLPGVFCAGEMLDWEAPTGGYLLTACFASGLIAGEAAAQWAQRSDCNSDGISP